MCKVIIAGNQKGGVAKTTTVANLGIGLARHRKRVLLIDGDAQGSLTASLGYPKPDDKEGRAAASEAVVLLMGLGVTRVPSCGIISQMACYTKYKFYALT